MSFDNAFKPWSYEEKEYYPFKKARILNIVSSFTIVYFVSIFVRDIFRDDILYLIDISNMRYVIPLMSYSPYLGLTVSFIVSFLVVYLIIDQLFCKRKNPYFKQVAIVWMFYSTLCFADTWMSRFLYGTWKMPEAVGGFEIATIVLFVPPIVAIVWDYYVSGDIETNRRVLTHAQKIRKKIATILLALGGINLFILTPLLDIHRAIYLLWNITMISLVIFLILLIVDNIFTRGETFHVFLYGRLPDPTKRYDLNKQKSEDLSRLSLWEESR